MKDILEKTLAQLGVELNCANIIWGVGASVLLNQYGLVDNPTDIDLMVDLKDVEQADDILSRIGERKGSRESDDVYETTFFYEYEINGIDVDLMAGLKIWHKKELHEYIFDKDTSLNYFNIKGVKIPFNTLEDWLWLYQVIPNRGKKVELIADYLKKSEI